MGGSPSSALAIAVLPYGSEAAVEEELVQLLAGAAGGGPGRAGLRRLHAAYRVPGIVLQAAGCALCAVQHSGVGTLTRP